MTLHPFPRPWWPSLHLSVPYFQLPTDCSFIPLLPQSIISTRGTNKSCNIRGRLCSELSFLPRAFSQHCPFSLPVLCHGSLIFHGTFLVAFKSKGWECDLDWRLTSHSPDWVPYNLCPPCPILLSGVSNDTCIVGTLCYRE